MFEPPLLPGNLYCTNVCVTNFLQTPARAQFKIILASMKVHFEQLTKSGVLLLPKLWNKGIQMPQNVALKYLAK